MNVNRWGRFTIVCPTLAPPPLPIIMSAIPSLESEKEHALGTLYGYKDRLSSFSSTFSFQLPHLLH